MAEVIDLLCLPQLFVPKSKLSHDNRGPTALFQHSAITVEKT